MSFRISLSISIEMPAGMLIGISLVPFFFFFRFLFELGVVLKSEYEKS